MLVFLEKKRRLLFCLTAICFCVISVSHSWAQSDAPTGPSASATAVDASAVVDPAQSLLPTGEGKQAENTKTSPDANDLKSMQKDAENPAPVKAALKPMVAGGPVFNPDEYSSIVFTHWEHIAIQDARNARGLVRPPTAEELAHDLKTKDDGNRVKPPPEEREIKLGGIVYHGEKDWAIWLNGKRVTPQALPKEVFDLKVYKTYVEMKWFDEYTNQIFPLRIRTHQRFNIDSRIFLPG